VYSNQTQPIRNPVTGAEHRIQVLMPEGLRTSKRRRLQAPASDSKGGIKFSVAEGHSSLAKGGADAQTGVAA